jgi:6-phosphogluconolactonase
MQAENHIQEHALEYERLIKQIVPNQTFDLSMLGMGDDGHTASLFPHTEGLTTENRLVIANHVPQKNTWRMSFTFEQIKNSRNIRIYVIGENKAAILNKVFTSPLNIQEFPSQALGWPSQKALWVLDSSAAKELQKSLLKA